MKALTLTQPWASLVACGAKTIETRSWRTPYRGPVAIHAAKGFPADAKDFSRCIRLSVLFGPHYEYPLGVIVATARIVACIPTRELPETRRIIEVDPAARCTSFPFTDQERMFGNYDPGRWAWLLADIVATQHIPAKGALGLWEWEDTRGSH